MSKQLTISATASVLAMALFAVTTSARDAANNGLLAGSPNTMGATTTAAAPSVFLRP